MIARRLAIAFAAVGLAFTAAACSDTPAGNVTQERLLNADSDPENWLAHGRTYSEDRFSPLDQINTGNIDRLSLAYTVEFDTNRGQEATPIVVDGVVQAGPGINIATIDFLARGGDQYPFRGAPFTVLGVSYQQALANYLEFLGVVTAVDYPVGGEGRILETVVE